MTSSTFEKKRNLMFHQVSAADSWESQSKPAMAHTRGGARFSSVFPETRVTVDKMNR